MLKALVPKFHPDLFAFSKDIAEKQVPAKLKPIVVDSVSTRGESLYLPTLPFVGKVHIFSQIQSTNSS